MASAPELAIARIVNEPTARKVPCPNCQQDTLYSPANPWRPFCSERCRSADLGAWATERFRVPAEAPTDDNPNLPEAP